MILSSHRLSEGSLGRGYAGAGYGFLTGHAPERVTRATVSRS